MGTFAGYIGQMDVPEERRAEYAQQMLKLLHAGGMMSVDEVVLFGRRLRLLSPLELDENGRAWSCYNYFENDFWEPWGLNAAEGTFYSNKLGGGAFRKAVLAGYVLTALFCESYGVVTADGTYVRERDYIGWINAVLGTRYTNQLATQVWEIEKLLHGAGLDTYNPDLFDLLLAVPVDCVDREQAIAYFSACHTDEYVEDMAVSREEADALRERKGISSRVAASYLQKTLAELHAQGGTLEDAKQYLVMPMAERRAVVNEQGGGNLAFAYSFVSPVPAAALTAHEFGADFWPLWDEVGKAIPNMNLFPAPKPCPPVEPVSTQELFHVSCDDLAYYWRPDGKVQFSDEMTAWMRSLRVEMDGIADAVPQENFPQAMVEAISASGKYAFRGMFYDFIARQTEPRVQAAVLLLARLNERGEPNVRRYLAILGNPALRAEVLGL